jgi:hypothetical protein
MTPLNASNTTESLSVKQTTYITETPKASLTTILVNIISTDLNLTLTNISTQVFAMGAVKQFEFSSTDQSIISNSMDKNTNLILLVLIVIPLVLLLFCLFALWFGRCFAFVLFRFTSLRLFPCFEEAKGPKPLKDPKMPKKKNSDEEKSKENSIKTFENVSLPALPPPLEPPISKFVVICNESDDSWLGIQI